MSRVRTSIAPDEDIETLLGRDETKTRTLLDSQLCQGARLNALFILCFGTFTDTARDSCLELVRCADAFVSLFQSNRHANTVPDTEAAPSGTNTTLNAVN